MYRKRLRPKYTPEELERIYAEPHRSDQWEDHKIRVRQTIALGKEATVAARTGLIADLSCGDGNIARSLAFHFETGVLLGDLAPCKDYAFTGAIEDTIDLMPFGVDLFVCSETVEHLDNPDQVLASIRRKSKQLLLSTPIGETNDENPEHYWGWDIEAVEGMLLDAGWSPYLQTSLAFFNPGLPYNYQIWLCK